VKYRVDKETRSEELPAQPAVNVSRASGTEIDLRIAAPPRRVLKLDSVSGSVRAVGAPKMLEFKFENPAKLMTQKFDGVTVKASATTQTEKRWSIAIEVEHPPGTLVDVQSFQGPDLRNFLFYRVWLSWNKNKMELEPTSEASGGAGVIYHFEARNGSPLPSKDADVTLHFRTPNRVVAFTAPFELRDLPLP
jgi:hypothetical protein